MMKVRAVEVTVRGSQSRAFEKLLRKGSGVTLSHVCDGQTDKFTPIQLYVLIAVLL